MYDFYFRGTFIKRFKTYKEAKKMVSWNENLTYTEPLYEIKTIQIQEKTERK